MKTIKFLLPLFVLGMLNSCDVETPTRAAKYNDKIITETDKISSEYDKIVDTYNEAENYEEVRIVIDIVKEKAEKSIKTLKAIGDFYEDNNLNEAGIQYIEKLSENCDLFHESLDMEEADNLGDAYDALDDKINNNATPAYDNLVDVQIKFAADHDITLE